MPISGMRTSQRTDSGFTLLELMFSLVIIGIMLGLGIGFFQPAGSELESVSKGLAANLAMARVEAMLSRKKVIMGFAGSTLLRHRDSEPDEIIQKLPENIQIAIDGKALMAGDKQQFVFSPMGHTRERYIQLHDGMAGYSIYVPSIGAARIRPGMPALEELRKAEP